MARSLVLGNGSLLVCLDQDAQVRDFYFDYVGLENQMAGAVHKIGVWIDDKISWISDIGWKIDINYEHETLMSKITAINSNLQVELRFSDVVYNEKNIFLRKIVIKNLANRGRQIKLFLNHQFDLYGVKSGDTAYFDPDNNTIIHYKGRRIVVIGGKTHEGKGFDDYTVGLIGIEGKEGTWKDAEDGILSKNPIQHGSVDSTIAFTGNPDSGGSFSLEYWIAAGKTLEDVKNLHNYVLEKTPEHLIESTKDYWYAWVNKLNFSFYGLDPKIIELFKKSLLIMRTHFDNTGAIIASGDSDILQFWPDTYAYVWPRDASFITMSLDKAGYFEVARSFFKFANEAISEGGYFFHKYRPDKSLGSSWHPWIKDGIKQLPIQEDETALVLYALWRHYELTHDLEFIESVYNSLIKKAGDFMATYRDSEMRLPLPSYDLWEMKYGVSTFTSSVVSASLTAISNFAKLLGKNEDETFYSNAAREVKEGIIKYLYNNDSGYFYKLIESKDGKVIHDETIDASSFYGVYDFNILDINDDRLKRAFQVLQDKILLKTQVGGVARFEGDVYYRSSANVAGNPWFITTMWLAQYYCKKAQNEDDLKPVKEYLEWAVKYSLPSGILSEQIDPYTGEQLSASPLIWSHAAFVSTVIKYLEKLEEWGVCKVCIPVK